MEVSSLYYLHFSIPACFRPSANGITLQSSRVCMFGNLQVALASPLHFVPSTAPSCLHHACDTATDLERAIAKKKNVGKGSNPLFGKFYS